MTYIPLNTSALGDGAVALLRAMGAYWTPGAMMVPAEHIDAARALVARAEHPTLHTTCTRCGAPQEASIIAECYGCRVAQRYGLRP